MIRRVVLDTDVVVSALLEPQGLEDHRLALAGRLLLCTSPAVLQEYARVLAAPKFKLRPAEIDRILKQLEKLQQLVSPRSHL